MGVRRRARDRAHRGSGSEIPDAAQQQPGGRGAAGDREDPQPSLPRAVPVPRRQDEGRRRRLEEPFEVVRAQDERRRAVEPRLRNPEDLHHEEHLSEGLLAGRDRKPDLHPDLHHRVRQERFDASGTGPRRSPADRRDGRELRLQRPARRDPEQDRRSELAGRRGSSPDGHRFPGGRRRRRDAGSVGEGLFGRSIRRPADPAAVRGQDAHELLQRRLHPHAVPERVDPSRRPGTDGHRLLGVQARVPRRHPRLHVGVLEPGGTVRRLPHVDGSLGRAATGSRHARPLRGHGPRHARRRTEDHRGDRIGVGRFHPRLSQEEARREHPLHDAGPEGRLQGRFEGLEAVRIAPKAADEARREEDDLRHRDVPSRIREASSGGG
mmetsp:Transcript_2785/g.7647  ORF Transcript_2785/g.7647 Transcript_2785/m.7647 type:complete len:380 (-) Transcript_2785:405-1544(-)